MPQIFAGMAPVDEPALSCGRTPNISIASIDPKKTLTLRG
jgi:hypothetical protein